MNEEQANEITKGFTQMLFEQITEVEGVENANLMGPGVYESGNVQMGETGFTFDVDYGGHSFNVEVYGPMYEEDEDEDD